MTLKLAGAVRLPPHNAGGYDHGDVHVDGHRHAKRTLLLRRNETTGLI